MTARPAQINVPATRPLLRTVLPALLLLTSIAALRLVYLLWFSPYSLAEDEAFYWEWAQHLAWSYNTKGPGIAWAMWLATSVLGDTVFAVRTIAVISSFIGALAVACLTADLTRGNRWAALLAAACYNLMPGFIATSLLSTIDGPYVACWAMACFLAVRSLVRGSRIAWILLGLVLGVGFLFKYTILLLPLGLAVFAWRQRSSVSWPGKGWVIAALACFGVGLLPVLIWNAQHEWVTVKHLLGHLGIKLGEVAGTAADVATGNANPKNSGYNPLWSIELVVTQLGIIGPAIIAMFIGAKRALQGGLASGRDASAALAGSLLVHAAWPILVFYLAVTFKAQAEGNWPMAGFVSLIPLAAAWVVSGRPASGEADIGLPARGLPCFTINATLIVGVVVTLGLLRLDWVKAGVSSISPVVAKAVPTGRVMGNEELAAHVLRLETQLKTETGLEPFVLSQSYGRASQLRFSLPGHPVVYVAQSRLGGRVVQQDYWPSHDVDDPKLKGRPAVIVADFEDIAFWTGSFERVERIGQLDGAIRAGRFGFLGYGYKGLPPAKPAAF